MADFGKIVKRGEAGALDKIGAVDIVLRMDGRVDAFEDDASYTPEQVFGPLSPGRLLKGLRAREGWTQSDLAERLGTTKTVISDMETGRRPISRKTAMKLEEMTGTDYRVFL